MKCPKCRKDKNRVVGVLNKPNRDHSIVVRYRKCLECGCNFKTVESVDIAELIVKEMGLS